MLTLLTSPITDLLTRRYRPPASMPLKEESPAATGISDVPVFTDSHPSTAKSTPASTFSAENASHRAKPEADEVLMALSAAGATVAADPTTASASFAIATLLSDTMPATPFSLAATPRHCSPQPIATAAARGIVEATAMASLAARALATPPEPRTVLRVADLIEPVIILNDESTPETRLEDPGATPMELDSPNHTPAAPATIDASESTTIPANTDATQQATPSETPARPSRRQSSRLSSSTSAQATTPQPQQSQPASPSAARRPGRPSRLSMQLAQESLAAAKTAKTAPEPATPKAKTAARSPAERRVTRRSGTVGSLLPTPDASSSQRRRSRRSQDKPASIPRELRRLEDTKEFSHVDDKPVVYTVWSNGKYVPANAAGEPLVSKKAKNANAAATCDNEGAGDSPRKRAKLVLGAADSDEDEEHDDKLVTKRVKKWLDKGLYAGQPMPKDPAMGLSTAEKRELAKLPELAKKYPENKTLPMPIFAGLRLLAHGRDFKMPYDIFNPLPPGQPKPIKYGRFSKNRFVGDAHAIWRKNPDFDDFSSKCVCKPETGCDEDCQNRIMLYECDDTNCNVGPGRCRNREFQRLSERTASKNPYHIGVEVFKTPNRGHGIRASRSFRPGQIIMEYIGEIITEEESDRRMNELYKNNACYYLMSFDQSLIIDGTSGSVARFVNHSCSPNCRMIKWIVSGQPRIALFAGDRPIMTGEELTYDYNFDPYSSKNVQTCLCGSENCRGILGPRKRDKALAKAAEKAVAEKAKADKAKGKRKLDVLGSHDDDGPAAKKLRDGAVKRGPGRPRNAEAGGRAKTAPMVTTTKAALAALAAKATRDARLAKASKAAKAARAAKREKAAARSEAAAAKVSKRPGRPPKVVKIVKAAKEVKVTKTVRGLKAAKTSKVAMAKAAKARAAKAIASKPSKPSKLAAITTSRAAARKRTMAMEKKTAEIERSEADAQEATPEDVEMNPAMSGLQATPMARALAKAAKAAAKASKAVKTAQTVGKIKPQSGAAKRATTMAAAATKRAGKARTAVKQKGKAAARAASEAEESVTTTAETAAPMKTGKRGGPSKMIQQKLNFRVLESPRRKAGRSPSTKAPKSPEALKIQFVDVKGLTGGKRPVGRPRGSKNRSRLAPAVLEMTEAGSEAPAAVADVVPGATGGVSRVSSRDVIHVAPSS